MSKSNYTYEDELDYTYEDGFDYCLECQIYGDDCFFDSNGELQSMCERCGWSPYMSDDDM